MDTGVCPICKHDMPIEMAEGKRGPYAGKHTAFCSFCGIQFVERKPEGFKIFLPKPKKEKELEPVLVEEVKPLPIVFRKAELITS